MDVEQFKDDVREGRIGVDRLVDLVMTLQRQLQAANRRIEEWEKKFGGPPTTLLAADRSTPFLIALAPPMTPTAPATIFAMPHSPNSVSSSPKSMAIS